MLKFIPQKPFHGGPLLHMSSFDLKLIQIKLNF